MFEIRLCTSFCEIWESYSTVRMVRVLQDPKGILADDILPDGTMLKKGGLVTYVPYSMGRMTALWGDDAKEFRPERWLAKDGTFVPVSPFKFTAFQGGPRICLGKDSAYLQMKMVTALLCRFFRFEVVQGHPVKYRMMAILSMAHGLNVHVTRRWRITPNGSKVHLRSVL